MKLLSAALALLIAGNAFAATPSPDNTVVLAGSSNTITDAAGNTWGIAASAVCTATWAPKGAVSEITENAALNASSCQVAELAYVKGVLWQENTSGQWYPWTGTGWGAMQTTSPVPVVTVPAVATLTWTAPTKNTDGSTITAPLTYNVYRGTSATALTKLTSVTGLTYSDPAGSATATNWCYAVKAVEAGTEGAASNVGCETTAAAALVPGAPALTVQ